MNEGLIIQYVCVSHYTQQSIDLSFIGVPLSPLDWNHWNENSPCDN